MFEQAAAGPSPAPHWFAVLGGRSGDFAPDRRFVPGYSAPAPMDGEIERAAAAEAETQRSLHEAFAAGLAEGRAEAEGLLAAEKAAHEQLRLAITRLDETLQRDLADRLAQTVAALCETALAPLALDSDALKSRCTSAARMFGEAQERLELHLHPDDIASLDPDFAAGWQIVPRPDFERGSVRVEGTEAGITDGPAEWRAALEAALAC